MAVRFLTCGSGTVAGAIGLTIILLTLSCASKMFDHPALADESSASAEFTFIRV